MFIFYWCNMCVCLSSPIIRICLDIRKKLYVWSGIFLVEDDNYFIQKTLIEMLPSWHRTNNLSKYGRKIGKINYRHCLDLEFSKLLLASGFWLKLCLLTWFIRNFLSLWETDECSGWMLTFRQPSDGRNKKKPISKCVQFPIRIGLDLQMVHLQWSDIAWRK